MNDIIYADCLNDINGLYSLKDKSVNVVFFDPPYNAGKDYGVYKDDLSTVEYVQRMRKVVEQSNRISKRGIGVYVDSWRFKLWWHSIFSDSFPIVIWKRSPGFNNELNIMASYHVILTNIKANERVLGLWAGLHPVSDGYYWTITGDYASKIHPAQTSYEIVEKFILNFTREKETALDPFMGTGTTLEACVKNNRFCKGYEINPAYEVDVNKRLKNCKKQPKQLTLLKTKL